MSKIHYGCQSYTWKMAGDKYVGKFAHIAEIAAKAGYDGIEVELGMMGDCLDDPKGCRKAIDDNGITLTALTFHQSCKAPHLDAEESALLEKTLDFLSYFPGARLIASHQANPGERSADPAILQRNRENLMACLDIIAKRAAEYGIVAAFHPNSSPKSLFRTREDYAVMFEMLNKTDMGYAADIGHIVNGGMDPLEILQIGRGKLWHVHFKDRKDNGEWALMNEGSIDYPAVVKYLEDTDYAGWVMVEDESDRSITDSDNVVIADGAYMARFK